MTPQEALERILVVTPVVESIGGINQSFIYTGSMELVVTWTKGDNGVEVIHIGA